MSNRGNCQAANCPKAQPKHCGESGWFFWRLTECPLGKWKLEPWEDPKAMDRRADCNKL